MIRTRSTFAVTLALLVTACATTTPREAAKRPQIAKPKLETKARTKEAPLPPAHAPEEDLAAIEAEVRVPAPAAASCEEVNVRHAAKRDGLIWPVDGVVISAFGQRDGAPHDGIDIAAPVGTPIVASRDGDVLYTGEQPGYGRIVILRHADDVVTIYAHNAKNCVADGARVSQGEVIALVGQSGDASSPSVHFEVRVGKKTVNPRAHLPD